ncbi:hypothetical protein W97_05019 [Coniosporium apollinis CBS 100218]|uniref:AB hydrolase-1 domain-containing protein n=1 Tax=Coniosporium apollinis (strain CBS 100218) TaxID=1168221 RepID=R7YV22_CONA1|nr:uncharacterized protein W97_05019 [Coniosporium apollinis CBS 100218]EON65780.1 hypothetical protein W97_05019 [Coniosporium apollinis CBS 100218]
MAAWGWWITLQHTFTIRTLSTASRESQTLSLPDGRTLGFAEYGSSTGTPVFFFHGLPGSRLEGGDWDSAAQKLNARIIAPDRPGMGLSSFQPRRRLLDWPADVHQLAHHLGLKRYHVMGGSGGGPYALACAKVLPRETLRAIGVVAGLGPREAGYAGISLSRRLAWNFLARVPGIARLEANWKLVPAAQNPDREVFAKLGWDDFVLKLKAKDRAVFEDKEVRELSVEILREAFKPGSEGYAMEAKLLAKPWGYDLRDVVSNRVLLWYGTEDEHTPLQMGRYMAERLPNAVLKEYPGDTHFTIFFRHAEEILRDLIDGD